MTAPDASVSAAVPSASASSDALPDGRSFGYIRSIDGPRRTISFDLAEFLQGDEADEAFREDNGMSGDEEVENDYYIRNQNTRLRTLHLADDVAIRVVGDPPDTVAGTYDDFVDGFASDEVAPFGGGPTYRGSHVPYWLNVADGEVVQIEEQYVP